MASSIVPDEFLHLPIWDNTEFDESTQLAGAFPASSTASTESSWSSYCDTLLESSKQSPLRVSSISTSGNIGSPQDSEFGYRLPSKLEDEIVVDRETADKEERRRKQNRLAQRAFRERKESKLKQLERKIADLKTEQVHLERKYQNLRTAHRRVRSGLRILLDAGGTFDDVDEVSSNLELKAVR